MNFTMSMNMMLAYFVATYEIFKLNSLKKSIDNVIVDELSKTYNIVIPDEVQDILKSEGLLMDDDNLDYPMPGNSALRTSHEDLDLDMHNAIEYFGWLFRELVDIRPEDSSRLYLYSIGYDSLYTVSLDVFRYLGFSESFITDIEGIRTMTRIDIDKVHQIDARRNNIRNFLDEYTEVCNRKTLFLDDLCSCFLYGFHIKKIKYVPDSGSVSIKVAIDILLRCLGINSDIADEYDRGVFTAMPSDIIGGNVYDAG